MAEKTWEMVSGVRIDPLPSAAPATAAVVRTTTITLYTEPSGRSMRLTLTDLDGRAYSHDLLAILRVGEDLSATFDEHPGTVAFWGTLQAELRKELTEAEQRLVRTEAQAYSKEAERLIKVVTATNLDKSVRMAIAQSRPIHAAQAAVVTARYQLDVLDAWLKALEHRRDMLMQRGAQERHEQSMQKTVTTLASRLGTLGHP